MIFSGLSTTNSIILASVAGVFILFALVSSFVLPRNNPNFPGSNMRVYLAICGAFFVVMMGTVLVFGVEDHAEAEEGHETPPAQTQPSETEPTETEPTETEPAEEPTETEPTATEPAEGEGESPSTGGDAAAGAEVWNSGGCGACHVMAAANATGVVGPNLDEAQPTAEVATETITNGKGAMPSFKGQLTEQQIADVVAYIVESTSS